MDVHLIAVEVSIVSIAVGVMHPDGLLLGQNASDMRHDRRLMQSWLPIHQQHVAVSEMAVDYFAADLQLLRHAIAFGACHLAE